MIRPMGEGDDGKERWASRHFEESNPGLPHHVEVLYATHPLDLHLPLIVLAQDLKVLVSE